MNTKQKALKQQYRETPRPRGIFQIRNLTNERVFIGKSTDLPGILNRHRFALQTGKHTNPALQSDWNALGADNFAFEILDELSAREATEEELRADLAFLENCWLDQLQPFGERGYNEVPMNREERLQMIMRNRQNEERE
jgi:GIY-YIG catalytic domain